ncbi:MAG: TetR/AcrR family transcriptional regulator [Cyanobacteria bacterium NC_groundwater_1444_Ag_S-0.65um_54_12]|nr:TetR/AcrR family transcriptional regulator [Cyanobacteria bacterium NC_groundwater_1444_Ag_S-0.65um_54_12]
MQTPAGQSTAGSTGNSRERLHADERRAQILRSATKVFARTNYRVAGMAEIAKEAGTSEPTVYKYFASKKQLFLDILARVGELTLRSWQEMAAQEPDAVSLLRRIARNQFEVVSSRPELLKVQFQALSEVDDAEIRQLLRANFSTYVAFLADIVRQGQTAGQIDLSLEVGALAWNFLAIGFTLNLTSLLGLSSELTLEKIEAMGDMLLQAAGSSSRTAQQKGTVQ